MFNKEAVRGELTVTEEEQLKAKAAEEVAAIDPTPEEAAKVLEANSFASLCPACKGSGIVKPATK